MPLESASFINGLDPSNPASGDTMAQADDHIRLIKTTVKATFPNVTGAITVDHAFLNSLVARIEQLEAGNYIGRVTANAGTTTPPRHLLCHGQAVSRTTYALLFAAIGTTYGPGDGATTFNVPDYRGRVPVGLDGGTGRVTSVVPALANLGGTGGDQWLQTHTHGVTDPGHVHVATTDTQGDHQHSGTTDNQGAHSHTYYGWGGGAGQLYFNGGQSLGILNTNTAGAHVHNFTTSSAGAHVHNITVTENTTGIALNSTGTGGSQNIQPSIGANYVIFAGA